MRETSFYFTLVLTIADYNTIAKLPTPQRRTALGKSEPLRILQRHA